MPFTYRFCPYCGKDTQCEMHFYYENGKCYYEYECIACGNMIATKICDFSSGRD